MNVKIARIARGLNQKQLAKMVGTSNVTIVKIEKGNFDNVRFLVLKKISEVLGKSFQELFFSNEE